MRIIHVISDGQVGGAGILLSHICEALKEEFEFEILLPEGSSLLERLPSSGVAVYPFPMGKDASFAVADLGRFYRWFRERRPDVVHTHAALGARIAAMMAGVPHRLSTRHCAHGEQEPSIRGRAKSFLYNRVTTLTVATAKAARNELCREGVSPDRIVTIRNGVPEAVRPTKHQTDALKAELGIRTGELVLGCCGRLETVKGQDLLIRAFARIAARFPRVRLLLIGGGSCQSELRRLAATLGIGERVILSGYVPNPTDYEALFDLNVNASRGTETSCLVTSECMSLGIPTVASDFGGNPEMIRNGINGLLFPKDNLFAAADAMTRLIEDRSLREKLGQGARRTWETVFSLDCMTERYRALYHALGSGNYREIRAFS